MCFSRAMRAAVAISSSQVFGRHGHEVLPVVQHPAVRAVPHAVDVPLLVGEGLDREGHVVGAVLRRPVGIERLHVMPFEEQRHPEAVHGGDVGQAAGGGGQEQLRLVHLEGGHDGDLELHVRVGARPLREDLAEDVRDGGPRGQVRVVLLGPHPQDERRVGAADADGGDERRRRSGSLAAETAAAGPRPRRAPRAPSSRRADLEVDGVGHRDRRSVRGVDVDPQVAVLRDRPLEPDRHARGLGAESTTAPSWTRSTRPPGERGRAPSPRPWPLLRVSRAALSPIVRLRAPRSARSPPAAASHRRP